jgi:hypothetical protein
VKSISHQEAQANFEDLLEDLRLAVSPEFWNMIQLRRQGRSIPLAELKARLGLADDARE